MYTEKNDETFHLQPVTGRGGRVTAYEKQLLMLQEIEQTIYRQEEELVLNELFYFKPLHRFWQYEPCQGSTALSVARAREF